MLLSKNSFTSFLFWCLLFCITFPVAGQKIHQRFGKNRRQYKVFKWEYYQADKCEVYFYEKGENFAKVALDYLQDDIDTITEIVGHHPYHKPKIFIYNSSSDLAQSNVGVAEDSFYQSGKTKFTKSFIEIAYTGTNESFRKELKFQMTKMIVTDQLYGGGLLDTFKSGLLISLPEWFIDGIARYLAEGWSVEMDDYMRDFLNKKKQFRKLSQYHGKKAGIIGQSIWNYIANVYKKNSISYIINLTRLVRDEEKSISSSLGLQGGFKAFILAWENYYLAQKKHVSVAYKELAPDYVKSNDKKNTKYINSVKISPEGDKIAFSRMLAGEYKIVVKSIHNKKEKIVYRGGTKLIDTKVTNDLPLLSWKNNDELGIISIRKGHYVLNMINVNNRHRKFKVLDRFVYIENFSFATSGTLAVVSGSIKNNSDIYIVSLKRNGVKKITRDKYDDINPQFVKGKKAIIFSSNRPTDSLLMKNKMQLKNIPTNKYNVFIYNIDTTRHLLKRITNYNSVNVQPYSIDDRNYLYLSDAKGINQLFLYNLDTQVHRQITNYAVSINHYDYNEFTRTLAFVGVQNQAYRVFVIENFNINASKSTPNTPLRDYFFAKKQLIKRQRAQNKKKLDNQFKKNDDLITNTYKNKKTPVIDTPQKNEQTTRENTENKLVDAHSLINPDQIKFQKPVELTFPKLDIVDTDNYVFLDKNERISALSEKSYLSKYIEMLSKPQIIGPLPYQSKFSTDNFVTSWVVDNYRGFGIKLETKMNSELENVQLRAGAMVPFDFRQGNDIFVDFEYLRYLIDFKFRYERVAVRRVQFINNSHKSSNVTNYNQLMQNYVLNKFELSFAYPFSLSSRIELTPFLYNSQIIDLNSEIFLTQNSINLNQEANYLGAKFSWIYDNARAITSQIYDGLRARVSYEWVGDTAYSASFNRFKIDLRYSLPIHKEVTLVGKLFYGRNSIGHNAPKYMLGGIQNWIFRKFTPVKDNDDLLLLNRNKVNVNLLLNDFVMGLRGYDLNASNGANAMLLNFEFRLPLFLYLINGHISSNFLKQFSLISFWEVGSAWNTSELLPSVNSINQEVLKFKGNAFEAVIDNFNSPWLSSYGVGIRAMLLGFKFKVDMAIPYDAYGTKSTRYLFSLGLDF